MVHIAENQMKAAVWHEAKDVRVEAVEIPKPKSNEVKVEVMWAGICGSDLHEYLHGPMTIPTETHPVSGKKAPLTLGHEFSGRVTEVGENVQHYNIGDAVVINPLVSCGKCHACLNGHENICDSLGFVGLVQDGGFAEYVVVNEKHLNHMPHSLSYEEGALVEPTAVAVYAVKRSQLKIGNTCAVFGVGPIGLLTIQAAKAAGATRIFAIDVSQERLEKAKEVGATVVINPLNENVVEAILSHTNGIGVDVCYEVAGVQATLTSALEAVKKLGEVMIISLFAEPGQVNLFQTVLKQYQLTGSAAYDQETFKEAIQLIDSGQIDAKKIITKKIKLENIVAEGFETLVNDKAQSKILIQMK